MSDLLKQYQEEVKTPPAAGDILTTLDGTPVVLNIQIEKGKPPFIYGRAYFNETLDETLGWYLRGVDDDRSLGWRCVLMTKARKEALIKCKVDGEKILVKSLKVVRKSGSGNSLLCEVGEYLLKVEEKPPQVTVVDLGPGTVPDPAEVSAPAPKIQVIEPSELLVDTDKMPDEELDF